MFTIKPKRILRPREAWERLGIKRQKFYEDFVATGRVNLLHIGARARGVLEADIDRIIDEMVQDSEQRGGDQLRSKPLKVSDDRRSRKTIKASPNRRKKRK
jgi:predicted DNA-binding transcriptional regulator AlpA